jgi:hypothetical protein
MATNALYAHARERFLNGSISWENGTIVASLVNGSYVVDFATHQWVSDLGGNLHGFPQTIVTSKSGTLGVADAADVVWNAGSFTHAGSWAGTYTPAPSAGGVVIYQGLSGTMSSGGLAFAGTSPLIAYYGTLVSFPFVWNTTSHVHMSWSNGTDRIFSL